MKYVYILRSTDSDHFYVGITDDLRARLSKHNRAFAKKRL
jgi:predicted GIY-YIG superfamily endonuclease